jgi:hypothetical protein
MVYASFLRMILIVEFERHPDTASVKHKMLYAGSRDALIRAMEGIMVRIDGTDKMSICEAEIENACKRF